VGAPSGTVTFLFTDIEGSTALWEAEPEAMRVAVARHDDVLRSAIEAHVGYHFSSAGDGVAAAFQRAGDAVAAAVSAQRALAAEPWPEGVVVRVRMGLHTGEAEERDGNYFGTPLNRAARLMAAANGGQIVISELTAGLVSGTAGLVLVDLGLHQLSGLAGATRAFGVQAEGLAWIERPLSAHGVKRGNLPRSLTEWFGRLDDLREHAAEVGMRRLVTFTGPGGVGKTRLAIELAALLGDEFPDGVWIVELAPVGDPDAMHATVATTLGVIPQTGMTTLGSILDWAQGRRMLLILDNCEHVLGPVVSAASAILAADEAVTVLATSREPLGVPGERVIPVPPLAPDDAVALFADRATALDATASFGADDEPAIRAICVRLDGIPLAIELAAARSRSLGPADLLARLDDRFRLLRGGSRGGLERHQTLRATVSWSYQLLAEPEQVLFDRLSVFAGGFDLEASEAVCGFAPIDHDDVLDLISALVDKSLVTADRASGATRYRLLETLRQYGEERLEERGEARLVRQRHLSYYLRLADRAYVLWKSARYSEGAAAFVAEWDNFRVAHTTAIALEDLDAAEALLDATYAPALHEQRVEFLDWAERTLGDGADRGHTAATCGQMASFLFRLGTYERTVEVASRGLAIARREPPGDELCLTYLLSALVPLGRVLEAEAAAARLVALLPSCTDPFLGAIALTTIIATSALTGLPSPERLLDQLEQLAASTAAPPLQELAALSLGMFLMGQEPPDLEGALVAFRRGVEAARKTTSATIAAANLSGLAMCSVRLGLDGAVDACRQAVALSHNARHWTLVWNAAAAAAIHLAKSGRLMEANVIYGHVERHWRSGPPRRGGLLEPGMQRLLDCPDADRWRAEGATMDRHDLPAFVLAHLDDED
jgi:predicted ATPase/class 3 adenylate cyclase